MDQASGPPGESPQGAPSDTAPVAPPRRSFGRFLLGASIGFVLATIASYAALVVVSLLVKWSNSWFLCLAETVGAILLARTAIKTRQRGFAQGRLVGGAVGLLLGAAFWWMETYIAYSLIGR